MINKTIITIFIITVLFQSCGNMEPFSYAENREKYDLMINDLIYNYAILFDSATKNNSISLYKEDLVKKRMLKNIDLFTKDSISFIVFFRDSTIGLYKINENILNSDSYILMHGNSRQKIFEKISTDTKLIQRYNDNYYEFKKIISIGN